MSALTNQAIGRQTMKNDRIQLRVSEERRARYEAVAAMQGKTLTEFVTQAADTATENALADRRAFVLDEDAWTRFNAILDEPTPVPDGLRDLFDRPDAFGSGT